MSKRKGEEKNGVKKCSEIQAIFFRYGRGCFCTSIHTHLLSELFFSRTSLRLTKIREGASLKPEVELVASRAVTGLGDQFVAFQVVLRPIVDGVSELVVAVDGAVSLGDGAAPVEAPGLVEHHLLALPLPDGLLSGTGLLGQLLGGEALLQTAVGVNLEHVGRPGHEAHALEALL